MFKHNRFSRFVNDLFYNKSTISFLIALVKIALEAPPFG